MHDAHEGAVLETYRFVRLAMVALVLMLAAAVISLRFATGCWQPSISAYYYTPAHGVFVAALCVLGACLIIYRGNSDLEDILLDFSGFLAFVVALVPTGHPFDPTRKEQVCTAVSVSDGQVSDAVMNNVAALFIAAGIGRLVLLILRRKAVTGERYSYAEQMARLLGWLVVGFGIGIFFLIAIFDDETRQAFVENGHSVAAISMFIGIIAVVLANAVSARRSHASRPKRSTRWYYGVAAAMAATLVAAILVRKFLTTWDHWVIALEAVLIIEFAIFWVVQTIELWDVQRRQDLEPNGD